MRNIALFYGGKSTEHAISCLSAFQMYHILKDLSYEVTLIGIDLWGRFYLQPKMRSKGNAILISQNKEQEIFINPGVGLVCKGEQVPVDLLLPLTHGTHGEDGRLQGMLSLLPIPFIGSDHTSSGIGMKKSLTKKLLKDTMIPMTDYFIISREDSIDINKIVTTVGLPLIVKPDCGGSSVGVSKVTDGESIQAAVKTALLYDDQAIIEPFLDVQEIECGVFGYKESLRITIPGSIETGDSIYSYQEKYLVPELTYSIPPAIEQRIIYQIKSYAKEVYEYLGCSGFARVDFFLEKDTNRLYLNEINTIPGMTETSLFFKLLEASEISKAEFIEVIITTAQKSFNRKTSLTYTLDENRS